MKKKLEIKKWFKKERVPFSELEEQICPNCEHEFKGHYCPNCGQATDEFDRPFGFVFYDFLGNVFAFDSRLWKTFLNLLWRPGFLTIEFFKGRRASYAPPFRVFIFLSFILFLLLQIATSRGLSRSLEHSSTDHDAVADSTSSAQLDSLNISVGDQEVELSGIQWEDVAAQENLRASLAYIADKLEARLERSDDPDDSQLIIKIIEICRSPEQLMTRILKYLSWAFFVLLPVFALLLKLFYIRRKTHYIRHLIFSVHFHSFLFLVFTVIVAVNLAVKASWSHYAFWLVLTLPVYLFISMKRFYKQGVIKTFFKGTLISMIYNLIIIGAFGYVVVNAISNL